MNRRSPNVRAVRAWPSRTDTMRRQPTATFARLTVDLEPDEPHRGTVGGVGGVERHRPRHRRGGSEGAGRTSRSTSSPRVVPRPLRVIVVCRHAGHPPCGSSQMTNSSSRSKVWPRSDERHARMPAAPSAGVGREDPASGRSSGLTGPPTIPVSCGADHVSPPSSLQPARAGSVASRPRHATQARVSSRPSGSARSVGRSTRSAGPGR